MKRSRPLSVLTSVLAITMITAVSCADRPQEGEIHFGADKPPVISSNSAISQFKNLFADVAETAIPTVVSVTSTKIDTVLYRNPYQQYYGSPFDFFFGNPQQGRSQPQMKEQRKSGVGSGVIVSKDGYILTNSHVINGADEITVTLSDDREFECEIIGVDTLSDVGVLKIKEQVDNLPVSYIGTSSTLRPGDMVMAVGNPFSLSSTVTTGIVSALGRHTDGDMYQNFIQTDAAINPGNSGGALVNMNGELIGINTMIYTRSGGYMGIGFAIPIDMAYRIMEQLIYDGKVSRGWLGVSIGKLDQTMMDVMGISKKGVLINDVFENQPAQKAGIVGGDVILSIDGIRTTSPNDLRNAVAAVAPGKKVPVVLIRNQKEMTVTVVLTDREKADVAVGESSGGNDLGLTLKPSDDGESVTITAVDPTGSAARYGLRAGDKIHEIKVSKSEPFRQVTSEGDLNKYLAKIKSGAPFMLKVSRNGHAQYLTVRK